MPQNTLIDDSTLVRVGQQATSANVYPNQSRYMASLDPNELNMLGPNLDVFVECKSKWLSEIS